MMGSSRKPRIDVQKLIEMRADFFAGLDPESALRPGRIKETEKIWLSLLGTSPIYWQGFSCLVGYFENQPNPPEFNPNSLETYIRQADLRLEARPDAVAMAGWAITRILSVDTFRGLAQQMGILEQCLDQCTKTSDPLRCAEEECY